jgi:hypothetical protein
MAQHGARVATGVAVWYNRGCEARSGATGTRRLSWDLVGAWRGVSELNKVSILLDEQALLELHEVLLDESPEAALGFVRKHIAPKVPRKGTAACDSSRLNPFILPGKDGRPGDA